MKNRDQKLFRTVFSDPRQAGPLLRHVVPPELCRAIEWKSLAPAPAAVAAGGPELLFSATWAGTDRTLYVLLTLRSDAGVGSVRAVQAAVRRVSRRVMALHTDAPPPSVLPVVILNGQRPWEAVQALRECSDLDGWPPAARAATEPHQGQRGSGLFGPAADSRGDLLGLRKADPEGRPGD